MGAHGCRSGSVGSSGAYGWWGHPGAAGAVVASVTFKDDSLCVGSSEDDELGHHDRVHHNLSATSINKEKQT